MNVPRFNDSGLSRGQQALWYLNQLEPASTAYHLGLCLRLTGSVNESALALAWTDLTAAHPQLRARFPLRGDEPVVEIDPAGGPLAIETAGEALLLSRWQQIACRPFNLVRETPVRVLLLRHDGKTAHLLFCLHHIAGDLSSSGMLLQELSEAYQARVSGATPALQHERMDFATFVAMENRWLESPDGDAAWNFWREYLAGAEREPLFPVKNSEEQGGEATVVLDSEGTALVRRVAHERGTTSFTVLLAGYARLLGECTGRAELLIGTPATLRHSAALRRTAGYLVNPVSLRCSAAGENSLQQVAVQSRQALAHRRFPFPVLVERLRVPREPGTTPLLQSVFAFYSLARAGGGIPSLVTRPGAIGTFGGQIIAESIAMPLFDPQFPLALALVDDGGSFSGRLQFDGRRVTAEKAAQLSGRFPELIVEFLAGQISPLMRPMPEAETPDEIGLQRSDPERLEQLFDETAHRTPDAIALSEGELRLSYQQVKVRAEILASKLNAVLPGNSRPVALQLSSTTESVILILAILKSGRAFQPIDPGEPEARRNTALRLTGTSTLITPDAVAPGNLPKGVKALTPRMLRDVQPMTHSESMPSTTAYLIFTSGSSGEPKAVEVGHASVINHARAMARVFNLSPDDRVLQFHTLAFDAAFEEIFPTWAAGARIVCRPASRELATPALLAAVQSDAVTVLNLPTSWWHMFTAELEHLKLPAPPTLRLLVVGGEPASWKSFLAWRRLAPGCRWMNTYGPTEATITALAFEPPVEAPAQGSLPIGRPIEGVTAVILDGAGKPMTAGEGELLLGGKGLAVGYHGDPALTAARFITQTVAGRKQRLYRTGDRVRLNGDGNFEYLGRIDRQLKIRGYRIDPEEIERALLALPGVTGAVVTACEQNGDLDLSAWISRINGTPTKQEARVWLSQRLPKHMIPSRLKFVDRLPRKANGKVDAAALAPQGSIANRPSPIADWRDIAPENSLAIGDGRLVIHPQTSRELTALFSKVLGRTVGLRDDFFLAGGHSLLAIKLLGRIEKRFGVRISLADFLSAPSPWQLLKFLRAAPRVQTPPANDSIPAETPVTVQQRRALMPHQIGRPSLANIAVLFRVRGQLDPAALARAVENVSRRNALLRCGFFRTNSGLVMQETPRLPRVEHRIVCGADVKRELIALANREKARPFILDQPGPWIRLLCVSAGRRRNNHLLAITHHAIADGWTFELLLDELRMEFERAARLPPELSGADYRAYAAQQANWLRSAAAAREEDFWRRRLAGAEEPRLPFRRAASLSSWRRERLELILPAAVSHRLRLLAIECGATPFAMTMACFKALIHRHSAQRDIVLESVVANRPPRERTVFGPTQNPVLVRDAVTSRMPMRRLVRRVARSLREAEAHGALPFERVVREALPQRPIAGGGIQFLSQDHAMQTLRLGFATLQPVRLPPEESPFELSVSVSFASPRFRIAFEYQPAIHSPSAMEHLAKQYEALLRSFADAPNAAVADLNLTPAAEQRDFERRLAHRHRSTDELLHAGFERQASRNPDAPAVVAPNRRLTYGELNVLAETVARRLIDGGCRDGSPVAVMLPKGWEQVVACLAILKAGGVYVPVDPALPASRLKVLFARGEFQGAIVADPASARNIPWINRLRCVLGVEPQNDTLRADSSRPSRKRPRRQVRSDMPAYIIFTSGSTGVPKGVVASHRAAMTTIRAMHTRFKLCSRDRVFTVSSLGFDLSVFDLFGTLRAGGAIVMPESRDPRDWLDQVRTEKVTVWNSVPCLCELLLDETAGRETALKSLRLVLLSGDFTSPALAARVRRTLPRATFVSLGGATEAAIWSVAREVTTIDSAWRGVPYGRPLAGQEMFVLDARLNHCPTGVAGELFIAGGGLAEGYWRNEPETRRRFLMHPRQRVRLYRTGDQGRYLENGEIEILGRIDAQVKWNGMRLEPGEIEAALRSLDCVRQAVVDIHDRAGTKRLVAYVIAEPGMDAAILSTRLRKILPAPWVPTRFIFLDRLPLTVNGKMDRAALRSLEAPPVDDPVAPPANAMEQWIANLWSELLGGVAVTGDADFFSLGGHSLLAIQMVQRVRAHFGVDLPLGTVLERPTVRSLAAAIAATATAPAPMLRRRRTAELERDAEPVIARPLRFVRRNPDAVLLTGATGHLGSALLIELLRRTGRRVYCPVRAAGLDDARNRLLKVLEPHKISGTLMQRIVVIPADLSGKRFGLNPAEFAAVARDVHAVYHCAAEVHFLASYEKLAASNVAATREVIRFATAANAVLHHVSSVAVFPYDGARRRHEDEDIADVTELAGGYAQSKWTAERMVWKAMAFGLRAAVYRPGQILGRATGRSHDLFHQVLRACNRLQAVPDLETTLDMIPVEYAAAAICVLSEQQASLGKAFHLVHPEPVALRKFVERLSTPPALLPSAAWLARLEEVAVQAGDPEWHLIGMLAQGGTDSDLAPPDFDCRNTLAGLEGSRIVCPLLDKDLLRLPSTAGS